MASFNYLRRFQSGRPDSNRRRPAWEAGILPTELRPRPSESTGVSCAAKGAVLHDGSIEHSIRAGGESRRGRNAGGIPINKAGEPQVRIELTTARLRIGCSTPELLWQVLRMPWSGLEPLCLSAPPPQDGVSTNFTTRANHSARDQRTI